MWTPGLHSQPGLGCWGRGSREDRAERSRYDQNQAWHGQRFGDALRKGSRLSLEGFRKLLRGQEAAPTTTPRPGCANQARMEKMPTDTGGWSPGHGQQGRGQGSREGAAWPGPFCALSEDSRAPGTRRGDRNMGRRQGAGRSGGKGK